MKAGIYEGRSVAVYATVVRFFQTALNTTSATIRPEINPPTAAKERGYNHAQLLRTPFHTHYTSMNQAYDLRELGNI
jgi:hypothetical protein